MATREELEAVATEAGKLLKSAQSDFEKLRTSGSAEDIVKGATAVVKAKRTAEVSQHEADTFELVGIYEGIRGAVHTSIVNKIDMRMLAKHDVKSVTITVPVQAEPVELDKVTVNTLGKRTVTRSTGDGGSRTRYVYGPEKLNSRQVVEAHGADEVGQEKAQATLDEPSKYGLTHLADRIAKKLDWDKVPA